MNAKITRLKAMSKAPTSCSLFPRVSALLERSSIPSVLGKPLKEGRKKDDHL